jgi:uncharacterized protein (TIGR02996 family)
MWEDDAFLEAIRANPGDPSTRLVYADWLDERGDRRGHFLRLHLALRALPPDHPHRAVSEGELSRVRNGLNRSWLGLVEPERTHLGVDPPGRPFCGCLQASYDNGPCSELEFHCEPQDTECDAWKRLLELIEAAATDGRAEFAPLRSLKAHERAQIVTLPPTIAKLKEVRHLLLYGSDLVRIPPEIGEMSGLEKFTPYTSYRLHWFPYEITRCKNLRNSTVSTRALYGNYKYRPPFPQLRPSAVAGSYPGGTAEVVRNCSVCNLPYRDEGMHRVWISLGVATDVLPLLVNACSAECVGRLPRPPERYVRGPHRGGLEVQQPPTEW